MTLHGFVSNGLTLGLSFGERLPRIHSVGSTGAENLHTCGLFRDDGTLVGTVANALGEPRLGRNAPTVYLQRVTSGGAWRGFGSERLWHTARRRRTPNRQVYWCLLGRTDHKPTFAGFVPLFRRQ